MITVHVVTGIGQCLMSGSLEGNKHLKANY